MFVDFESLDNSARIWVYQSNREFSTNEMVIIKTKVENFDNTLLIQKFEELCKCYPNAIVNRTPIYWKGFYCW